MLNERAGQFYEAFFGVQCLRALNVQFHSNSFKDVFQLQIHGGITFFTKLFSCLAIIFVSLVELGETSESEPGTFPVMNIDKNPQTAMPSSFITP